MLFKDENLFNWYCDITELMNQLITTVDFICITFISQQICKPLTCHGQHYHCVILQWPAICTITSFIANGCI